jgi:N-sulfoglucosamine sulfohydrolase
LGRELGCYGDSAAVTPNIDRLAAEGTRFTNAFATTASCSPSRSVMLTGLFNHSNGTYGLAQTVHNFHLTSQVQTLPVLLKASGYQTGVLGKLHVNGRFDWDTDDQRGTKHVTDIAEKAKDFIQNSGSRPWYLHIGFGDPHREGKGFGNEHRYRDVTPRKFDPDKIPVPEYLPNNPATRADLADYYEAVHRLDQGVGKLLAVLEETGQLANTLVVFSSDNGIPFANAKTGLYDAGVRLPFIVRSPEQAKRGIVNDALISFIDLVPSFLEWSGAKGPASYELPGRSWLGILDRETAPERERVFLSHTFHGVPMFYPMRGIRTRRYKYIRNLFPEIQFPHASDLWGSKTWQEVERAGIERIGQRSLDAYLHRPPEELYDITSDPLEVRNLVGSKEHDTVLAELRSAVGAWRKQTNDPWNVHDTYNKRRPATPAPRP